MKSRDRAQVAILAGGFGFFLGGLLNVGKELIDIMLGAAIGWGAVFFATFAVLQQVYGTPADGRGAPEEQALQKPERAGAGKKGKKIDITVSGDDDFEDIFKIK